MMKMVNRNTKEAARIIGTFNSAYWNKGDINTAYKNPSAKKVRAYNDIWFRASRTKGYNHDLRITGASCHQFSTMYSYTDENGTHIVYDTASQTKIVTL